jgi:ATP-dependent helicase/nuclease subunit A
MAASQTHKALAAALAKRVEFDLADDAGVVDASVPPFQVQAYPELAALQRACRGAAGASPATSAGATAPGAGRRVQQDPAKGGGRHHRLALACPT